MKNMFIIIVCAATASIALVVVIEVIGVEGSAVIGGAVGGVVGGVVGSKLYAKQNN